MSEILSVVRLKDRIIIASLMVIFAVLLSVGIGAVTEATVDPHIHKFEYHLEKGADGKFDFVGVCTDEACEDPIYARDILNAEVSIGVKIKVAPTCTADGIMEYSFTPQGSTEIYTCEEKMNALSATYKHTYVAEDTKIENGNALVSVKCSNEGCKESEKLTVESSKFTFVETVAAATCHTPKVEIYSYNYKGVAINVTASTEEIVPHKLNGVYVTELQLENGAFPYGTEGITIPGYNYLSCGGKANGHYTCEVCSQVQPAPVVRADHSFEYVESETVLPTDENMGSATLKCTADDCSITKIVYIPKIAIDQNAELLSQDQDKEIKTVKYTYVDGEYGFAIEAEIVIPWLNHRFEFTEADVIRPTFNADGSVTLKCQNSVCSEERIVVLPKMAEADKNTSVVYYHILEKKTITYLYKNTDFDFEINFSYDEPWIDHTYTYRESETVMPDIENDGVAYVRCSYKGCEKYHEITIPKIVVGENAKIIFPATEQAAALARYSYKNDDYNFTVTFDFNIGDPLSHDYKYKLDLNIFTGNFDFVGKCNQPGCLTPEVREENVDVFQEEHSPTCTTDGYLIVRYDREGEIYELTMKMGSLSGHDYQMVRETRPTWSKEGSAVLECVNDGCNETVTIVLPKIEHGVTAFELDPESEDPQLYYIYNKKEYGYEIFFLV